MSLCVSVSVSVSVLICVCASVSGSVLIGVCASVSANAGTRTTERFSVTAATRPDDDSLMEALYRARVLVYSLHALSSRDKSRLESFKAFPSNFMLKLLQTWSQDR